MDRSSRVIVLAEDRRHQRFIHRYLERLGYSLYDIRFEDLPSARGCGEQWVRDRYARAVNAYRARSARAETAVVVAIDADNGDVDRRLRRLQDTLIQSGFGARTADERIAHMIPKWSIETWILCLNGNGVDENTDYRREHGIDSVIKTAAVTFFAWSRLNATPPLHCVPSLLSAIPEARRLE